MKTKIYLLLALTLIVFSAGCSSRSGSFRLKIDSISAVTNSNGTKYYLLPGVKDVTEEDLHFKEYSEYVVRALKSKGFIQAKSKQDADIAIFVFYYIDTGRRSYRFLTLTAYDLYEYRRSEKEVQLWKTEVVSSGSSDDLRRVFPVLVAGALDYIGSDTEGKITVTLDENDDVVKFIKGIELK